jgi:serine/threonine-protein kinase
MVPGDRATNSATNEEPDRLSGAPAPPSAAFPPGTVVDGKYVVEGTIAEGGLGIVLRARHTGLGQTVAIKYLKPHALANPAVVERFEREARLAAQIASDHVVRVQDVGRIPGVGPYMVMEHLVGRDLGSIVEEGPLPVARAVDYILQACDALAEAHALRIVHRDIKPDNLFLAQRPSNTAILKIIDFGISRAPPQRDADGNWKRQTSEEERFGTPLYMSPEQLRSAVHVDQRTDIWSLGVVLFELLAGKAPFDGEDVPELYANILRAEPASLRQARPDVPPALEAAVLRCLQKPAADRFRNVAELAQELEPFGTSDAGKRISRIKNVVRRGGHSVRPPTPAPFAPVPVAISMDSASGGLAKAAAATPERGRALSTRTLVVAIALAMVLGSSLVLVLAGPSRSPGTASSAPAATPSASVIASAPVPSAASTPGGSVADLGPDDPSVATAPSTSASAAPLPPSPQTSSAAGAAPPRPRPTSSTSSPPDRRTLFGDRK